MQSLFTFELFRRASFLLPNDFGQATTEVGGVGPRWIQSWWCCSVGASSRCRSPRVLSAPAAVQFRRGQRVDSQRELQARIAQLDKELALLSRVRAVIETHTSKKRRAEGESDETEGRGIQEAADEGVSVRTHAYICHGSRGCTYLRVIRSKYIIDQHLWGICSTVLNTTGLRLLLSKYSYECRHT
jgi:hypothetical protein